MRKPLAAALAALTIAVVSTLTGAAPAQAHTSAYYASGLWPDNQSIGYGVDIGYPLSGWRLRLPDGSGSWQGWTSSGTPDAYWSEADDVEWGTFGTFGSGCTLRGKVNVGGIYMQQLDVGTDKSVAARTTWCNSGSTRKTFQITVDSDMNFYTGTGLPTSSQVDLWSILAHEFGHALGQNTHFTNGDVPCPANDTKDTMCPGTYAGSINWRTLGTHDKHTIDNSY